MADTANSQAGTALKKGITKTEAVRRALVHFGSDAKPAEIRPWLLQQFGIDMSTDQISNYKSDIRKKAGKAKAPAPKAPVQAKAATPKPAAKKSGVSKSTRKKPATPRPQAQQAAARSNALPKGGSAGRGISLDD